MNRADPLRLEVLEGRLFLSVSLDGSGNLIVGGTAGDDVINIHRDHRRRSKYLVTVNGAGIKVPLAPVAVITVHAGDGSDQVYFSEQEGRISARKVAFGENGDDALISSSPARHPSTSSTYFDGGDGYDLLSAGSAGANAATLLGGAGDDNLFGSPQADSLDGGDGNDRCDGNGGADFVAGGAGNDSLQGGPAASTAGVVMLLGGDGDDDIIGSTGDDSIDGGAGNDRCTGNDGTDFVAGGLGNDTLAGGHGPDTLQGGDGNDSLSGYRGSDLLRGDAGDDTLIGKSGNDLLFGGAGNDRIEGGINDDQLYGDAGDDVLIGGDGNDTLAGDDEDTVDFDNGNARIAPFGTDILDGGAGSDVLLGGPRRGSDGAGRDVLTGGADDDILNAAGGVYTERQRADFVPNEGPSFSHGADVQFHYLTFNLQIVGGDPSRNLIVPAIVGSYPRALLRTIDSDGTVQIKYSGFSTRQFKLGQFFTVWGVTFDSRHLGRFVTGKTMASTITMTINGAANEQFENDVLNDGDQIVIDLGSGAR